MECLCCGKEFEPNEKTMKVYTCCARFYLCEDCTKKNGKYWEERMEESKNNGGTK